MRTKHLLAALVLPAVFSACSQDELPTNAVENEVIGTPIGYDLEFEASFDGATTRLASGIGWEENDKIGMGWISDGNLLQASANLFSNHPIYYKTATGKFRSETMIYEGLYIASFPYQLTQKISPLVFDLSKQVSETSRYVGRWHVSDKFLELKGEAAGLSNETKFQLTALTNLMKLHIDLPEDATMPEDFKVTGVVLNSNSHLVNKLVLESNNTTNVKVGESPLNAACWDITNKGDITVQVGEENVGSAISKDGLDVYVQLGILDASSDATTLTIKTNYGDATISSVGNAVSYSTDMGESYTDVADFAAAAKAMGGLPAKLGNNLIVKVTFDPTTIEVPTTVTNQADLDKVIAAYEAMGKLGAGNTTAVEIEFSKSKLEAGDQGAAAEGDVILTDLSGLNKFGGKITFKKASSLNEPTNVYISGELALKVAEPAAIDFTVMNGQTLTISENVDLGSSDITVDAGATLINKAKITTGGAITTIVGSTVAPIAPAGLYISETGADASDITTFTNGGAIEWKGGTLLASMTGTIYANVATALDMVNASAEFAKVTSADKEIIIAAENFTVNSQYTTTELAGITKMTIRGKVTFDLKLETSFVFSNLTAINIESGSLNFTGGNAGEGENDFYAFTAGNCQLDLAAGTELNLAVGTRLDLGSGSVTYTNATITNNGWIEGNSSSGSGTWTGNIIDVNPKKP
ncbi:fimbrillin family protein [Bacteroides sp. GD17]|jgi:hypothetical protein|uniref:fimbrillin family protein n=1 Tax=Bacteroides sp. GD17 TaxID=3139826 RepID=UPI00313D2EA2